MVNRNAFRSQMYRGYAHAWEIMARMGLKKLPKEGIEPVAIDGVIVWVNPSIPRANDRKSSTHRLYCMCPECGSKMSVGRLFQHKCKSQITFARLDV